MNDYSAQIFHEDRTAQFRREADASRLAFEARQARRTTNSDRLAREREQRRGTMSTTKKVGAGSMLAVAALVLILIAAGGGRVGGTSQANVAGNAAWSERMTQHAQYLQDRAAAVRAADAWSTRLTGLAKLEGKAPAAAAPGMSAPAIKAWSDRLTGLAEYLGAK